MTTRRAGGFTLIELVVSLSMMAVLTTGLASAILLMTHALPSGDSPVGRSARATDLLERMTRDRKSTRLNSSHTHQLVCRLLLEKKNEE